MLFFDCDDLKQWQKPVADHSERIGGLVISGVILAAVALCIVAPKVISGWLGMATSTFESRGITYLNDKFKEEKDEAKQWLYNKFQWINNRSNVVQRTDNLK